MVSWAVLVKKEKADENRPPEITNYAFQRGA